MVHVAFIIPGINLAGYDLIDKLGLMNDQDWERQAQLIDSSLDHAGDVDDMIGYDSWHVNLRT